MLQLHIVDLGIAIPLLQLEGSTHDHPTNSLINPDDKGDFLVFTLDQTTISACSCGAIISSGSFKGFCLRFAENFQQTSNSWKPEQSNTKRSIVLDACCVPSGKYSMHSLAKHLTQTTSARLILNFQWEMEGIDIHLSTNFGRFCSRLIRTITSTQLIESSDKSHAVDRSSTIHDVNSYEENSFNANTDDPAEDIEKRKRLEYEYSILGQKLHLSQ